MAQGVSGLNLPKIFQSGVESPIWCSPQMGDLPNLWKAGNWGMVITEAVPLPKDTTFSSPPLYTSSSGIDPPPGYTLWCEQLQRGLKSSPYTGDLFETHPVHWGKLAYTSFKSLRFKVGILITEDSCSPRASSGSLGLDRQSLWHLIHKALNLQLMGWPMWLVCCPWSSAWPQAFSSKALLQALLQGGALGAVFQVRLVAV